MTVDLVGILETLRMVKTRNETPGDSGRLSDSEHRCVLLAIDQLERNLPRAIAVNVLGERVLAVAKISRDVKGIDFFASEFISRILDGDGEIFAALEADAIYLAQALAGKPR